MDTPKNDCDYMCMLKEVIYEITNDTTLYKSNDEKHKFYEHKYQTLSDKYKMIIKKACEPDFDVQKLLWMIDMRYQIDKKELTTHEASIEVGKNLVDEYIKPKLSKNN